MTSNDGISVVTTTWNEKANIEELIQRIRQTLKDVAHEIIVVDDSSTDDTFETAKPIADLVISKVREGQTKGLLVGAKQAKFPTVITIDSDLENPPELIPKLIEQLNRYDVVSASRNCLPRWSEKYAAKTLGKTIGVSDFYSNFRAFKKEVIDYIDLKGGETFGGELLVIAKKKGFKIGEIKYEPSYRRKQPRIGGAFRSNLRINIASIKCWLIYHK